MSRRGERMVRDFADQNRSDVVNGLCDLAVTRIIETFDSGKRGQRLSKALRQEIDQFLQAVAKLGEDARLELEAAEIEEENEIIRRS